MILAMDNLASKNQRILISGASVAGPALAYWLARRGFRPTVVERAPSLRGGGYAVDFRGPVHLSVLEKMGIGGQIREQQTHLAATTYVDSDGRPVAQMPAGIFAGDVEILRGDLGRILYEATRDGTEYLFGDSITALRQDADGVQVTFAHAAPRTFDLVIGADGLHSNVRRLAFAETPGAVRDLGLYVSIYSVADSFGLDHAGLLYSVPGKTAAVFSARQTGQAVAQFFFTAPDGEPISYGYHDTGQQQKILASAFDGVGWHVPRLLEQLPEAADFYFDSVSQVHLDRWSAGRVALIGDAGYAAGPGGNGTGTAVVAAYVLAGELAAAGGDHRVAFARYEQLLRPYVARGQKQASGGAAFLAPATAKKISQRDRFFRTLSRLPVKGLIRYLSTRTATAIKLPDYPSPAPRRRGPFARVAGMLADVEPQMSSPALVGRSDQLSALDTALAEVGRGRPSTVLVGGEAGVGKSRLVSEFAERSRGAGARVLIGGCLELGAEGLPFVPFTFVLRGLVRDLGVAAVAELLPGGASKELARLLPEFGEPAGPDGTGEARARLFEQMLLLLEHLAEAEPVVLVIEDMHWADRSTRDLLAFLIRNQPTLDGVLIMVTYRSDDLHRSHPLRPLLAELDRIDWVTRMDLGRLTRQGTGQLVAQIIGRDPDDDRLAAVYRRTEGNPLFVEALLGDGELGSGLPESLHDLLVAGVRRLPEESQEVVRVASAGGERTGHGLLAAVTGLDGTALARALRPAVAANVLLTDPDGYMFRHALIREAVHDELLPGERSQLHSRFAEAIGADPALVMPGRAPGEQSYHWYAAHDTTRALMSAWKAADQAGRSLAYAEQLAMLSRVLELWPQVPDAARADRHRSRRGARGGGTSRRAGRGG